VHFDRWDLFVIDPKLPRMDKDNRVVKRVDEPEENSSFEALFHYAGYLKLKLKHLIQPARTIQHACRHATAVLVSSSRLH
jgi:hypothetical protein